VMLCAERAAPPVARGEFARAAPPCMTEMGTRSGRGSVGIALVPLFISHLSQVTDYS
jgi:hypothetical protein